MRPHCALTPLPADIVDVNQLRRDAQCICNEPSLGGHVMMFSIILQMSMSS
jgi:hypothetical protein